MLPRAWNGAFGISWRRRAAGCLTRPSGAIPVGGATRVLARAAWLQTLADCLEIQPDLPPGWIAVPRDGSAVVTDLTVTFGAADTTLERRAEVDTLTAEVVRLDAEASAARTEADEASRAATATARRWTRHGQRSLLPPPCADARRRLNGLPLVTWRWSSGSWAGTSPRPASQARSMRTERGWWPWRRPQQPLMPPRRMPPDPRTPATRPESAGPASAVAAWEQRAADLRARRDRLAGQATAGDLARRDAKHAGRAREATVVVRGERLVAIDRELERLGGSEAR